MNDKERLQRLKRLNNLSNVREYIEQTTLYEWLINRVEELEEERDEWKDTAQSYYMTNQELREQNKRYQKAIKECVERMNEGGAGTRSFVYETLKKILEGEE